MAQSPISAKPQGEGDPSMDDILASIRRILSDEEKAAKSQAPSDGVLRLDPSMMVEEDVQETQGQDDAPTAHVEPIHLAEASGRDSGEPEPPALTGDPRQAQSSSMARPPIPSPLVAEPFEADSIRPEPVNVGPSWADRKAGTAPPSSTAGPDPLVAAEPAAMAAASVGALMRTLVAERNAVVHRGGPSIEDLVREEVRPLLKAWLDAHLPALVERLVRAEIERVVGRITG